MRTEYAPERPPDLLKCRTNGCGCEAKRCSVDAPVETYSGMGGSVVSIMEAKFKCTNTRTRAHRFGVRWSEVTHPAPLPLETPTQRA